MSQRFCPGRRDNSRRLGACFGAIGNALPAYIQRTNKARTAILLPFTLGLNLSFVAMVAAKVCQPLGTNVEIQHKSVQYQSGKVRRYG